MSESMRQFFTIIESPFTNEQIENLEKMRSKFILTNPSKELIEIYEVNRLADLIGIRSETKDSPEYQYLIKNGETIPPNKQNPNFTQMVLILQKIRKEKEIKSLKKLVTFIKALGIKPRSDPENSLRILSKWPTDQKGLFDVRMSLNLESYLNYLFNKYIGVE